MPSPDFRRACFSSPRCVSSGRARDASTAAELLRLTGDNPSARKRQSARCADISQSKQSRPPASTPSTPTTHVAHPSAGRAAAVKLLFTCNLYLRVPLTLLQRGNHSGPSLNQSPSAALRLPFICTAALLRLCGGGCCVALHDVRFIRFRESLLFFFTWRRPRVGTASGASLKHRRSQKTVHVCQRLHCE